MELMHPDERANAFKFLGDWLGNFLDGLHPEGEGILTDAILKSARNNSWFPEEAIYSSLRALASMLAPGDLDRWLQPYGDALKTQIREKNVGVVMAGNIPLVGFHDYLCVLISGHRILAKYSVNDPFLLPAIHEILGRIEPRMMDRAVFTNGRLQNFDAVIATGSNNTARYFEYYFRNYPAIIRKNRSSLAVLTGSESDEQFEGLAEDVMQYFGLGCRSVSQLLIPENFTFDGLGKALSSHNHCLNHHKFRNNYDYHHAVFLINKVEFMLLGPCLVTAGESLISPVSVVFCHHYSSLEEVLSFVDFHQHQIQTIVATGTWPFATVRPGQAQNPKVWDYADGIDTLHFLLQ